MKRIVFALMLVLAGMGLHAQDLTILHINDTHSHIEPDRSGRNKGAGGVIEQAAYIDSVRFSDGKGNVMLLHAGDFSQGTSYFTELGGDIEIDVLNAMKFDAVCLGNHEFDNGIEELARRLGNLEVPVVCANYDFSDTPIKEFVKPYVILEKARRKIGVIGLLTDLSSVVDVSIAERLKYFHPAETAEKYARELKEKGCELVICLTHLGYEGEFYIDQQLAAATRNVDIIVGGHSHTYLDDLKKVRNLDGKEVIIVTDGKWGYNMGRLAIDFQPNRLTQMYRGLKGKGVFKTGGEWFPYPAYADRNGWSALLGDSVDYLVRCGEKYLDYVWQSVPATAYLALERTGERAVMEAPLHANRLALCSLMLAELAEGQGRFMDQIINGVWHLSHMPSWVLSAHLPRQKSKRALPDPSEQIIDLVSGPTGALVAVTWHFFKDEFDKVDPVISRVIRGTVRKQVLDPYFNPDVQRGNWWKAFDITPVQHVNNWNTWCNADVMLCFLLMEEDQARLDMALEHSVKSVDKFLAYVKADGACEEGPAYWGHAAGKLYDYLQIMYDASGGALSLFDDPQIRRMGEYISRTAVKDKWVVNFADASASLSYPVALMYNYGKAVGSMELQDFALYQLGNGGKQIFMSPVPAVWTDAYRALESLRFMPEVSSRVAELNSRIGSGEKFSDLRQELRRHVPAYTWYQQTEFCYMHNATGWYLASKGGHNNESHNHNDIGTFILYVDGVPMFVDAGVGTYTKDTFNSKRYKIWSMCSDWHNLPVINGVTQKNGREFRSSEVKSSNGKTSKQFSLNIAGAYPQKADCRYWRRSYKLTDNALILTDTYELKARKAADTENFLVQGSVYMSGEKTPSGYIVKNGEVVVCNGGVQLALSYPGQLKASVEVKELGDPRLTNVWGDSLRRISFASLEDAPLKGKYVFKIRTVR